MCKLRLMPGSSPPFDEQSIRQIPTEAIEGLSGILTAVQQAVRLVAAEMVDFIQAQASTIGAADAVETLSAITQSMFDDINITLMNELATRRMRDNW
jgi:hypothetical protein